MWASGDFSIIGTTLQIVGETLCEAVDLRSGSRVLDVAAGNGNCTLAAARRWADVTSTDYVQSLLDDGRRRAAGDRFTNINFQLADVEQLPFADNSFDYVLSSFGVMFAPNQPQAAAEMLRVCRPGGTIGLANWTAAGFIGKLLKRVGKVVKPVAGVASPILWGDPDHLRTLFGNGASNIRVTSRDFVFRYRSPEHWLEVFRNWYGPTYKAFESLPADKQQELAADILDLIAESNVSGDTTAVIPSEYVEVVITKR